MKKGTSLSSGQRQKKSVTTLLEGRTPVKSKLYVSDDPPSRVARKTVSTTIDGMTPKKERYYNQDEAPSMTMPVSPWTKPTTTTAPPPLSYSPSSSSSSLSSPPTAFELDEFSYTKRTDFNSTQRSDFFQLSDDFLADVESLELPSPPPIKTNSRIAPPADPNPGSPEERPKTSRREPNPSPEKFTDYVITTPERQNGEDSVDDKAPAMFAIYLLGLAM